MAAPAVLRRDVYHQMRIPSNIHKIRSIPRRIAEEVPASYRVAANVRSDCIIRDRQNPRVLKNSQTVGIYSGTDPIQRNIPTEEK
jgi:hypothetical protein